jgi:hypothetical protein
MIDFKFSILKRESKTEIGKSSSKVFDYTLPKKYVKGEGKIR